MAKEFAQKSIGSMESLRTRWPWFEAWRNLFKVGPVKAKGKPIQNGNAPSAPIAEEESTKEHVKSHAVPESTDNVEEEILPGEEKGVEIEIESPSIKESAEVRKQPGQVEDAGKVEGKSQKPGKKSHSRLNGCSIM
ncbi:unnamed protein product [Cuscuta campestris]|uniref:Uncharacterized protein n=1 Tax=Cuscuta campestris TaxID=132261 RepID=A0A484KZ87_9ASTE|nr:unnamed protein product [Cuscuta campestris]